MKSLALFASLGTVLRGATIMTPSTDAFPLLAGIILIVTLCLPTQAAVIQSQSAEYDVLGRTKKEIFGDGRIVDYEYDANGNLKKKTESLSNNLPAANTRTTRYDYDALNRLKTITDADGGTIALTYDGRDNLLTVRDPRSLLTSYRYNGFDELIQQTSPDTGTTRYDRNSIPGLLKKQTDARNKSISYTYDALGRLLLRDEGLEKVSYTWDTAINGQGLLAKMERRRGNTLTLSDQYSYDAFGRLASSKQTIYASSTTPITNYVRTVAYDYDPQGRLSRIIYPNGKAAGYRYGRDGRIAAVQYDGADIITNIQWQPLGNIKSWDWANGVVHTRTYDLDGRLNTLKHGTVYQKDLDWDLGGRISASKDLLTASGTQNYVYDKLDHLRQTTRASISDSYSYDANGNRLSAILGTATSAYSYSSTNNRLSSISGSNARSYSYDSSGNMTSDGRYSYSYTDGGRLTAVNGTSGSVLWSYYYNGIGERIIKTDGGDHSWAFVYDSAGHLLGEYQSNDDYQQHIWLGDIPIANVRSGSPALLYVLADHLNTPRRLINPATNMSLWTWEGEAFGSTAPNAGSLTYNLRFPGQYYDKETARHYNYFRDYDPSIGRYVESDPIGLSGGVNSFSYALANPINRGDFFGLDATSLINTSGGRSILHGPTNGNWGGKCWGGGRYSCDGNESGARPPTDSADECYMRHDNCYDSCGGRDGCAAICDRNLVNELRQLPDDPRNWPNPPRPGTERDSRRYREWAQRYFDE